jgi:Holliday junction resolvase
MGKMQRNKGAAGERELAKLLSDQLGAEVSRNLLQTREGGHDLDGLPFALEVKRQEGLKINTWWKQAVTQSQTSGLAPALAYRQSRRPWRFVVLCPALTGDHTAEISLGAFCEIVRGAMQQQVCHRFIADQDQLQQIRDLCTRLGVSTSIPLHQAINADF